MKQIPLFLLIMFLLAGCYTADKIIDQTVGQADYPLPKIIEPTLSPVAQPVVDVADEVLKERTIRDTTQDKNKISYKARLFPQEETTQNDGTAFKLSW